MRRIKKSFEPKMVDRTEEDGIAFFAFVPSQIKESDVDKEWWPLLEGFPLNILYASVRQGPNMSVVTASAFYEPDPATFRGTDTARELTYFNKLGGDHRVRVVFNNAGDIETFKYKGENLIAHASGRNFDRAMTQTTMIGTQEDEPAEITCLAPRPST